MVATPYGAISDPPGFTICRVFKKYQEVFGMLYNLIAINKYGEEIKLNESPLSMEEIIADDIEETRRVFAKPSMGKCRVEIVPVREAINR